MPTNPCCVKNNYLHNGQMLVKFIDDDSLTMNVLNWFYYS